MGNCIQPYIALLSPATKIELTRQRKFSLSYSLLPLLHWIAGTKAEKHKQKKYCRVNWISDNQAREPDGHFEKLTICLIGLCMSSWPVAEGFCWSTAQVRQDFVEEQMTRWQKLLLTYAPMWPLPQYEGVLGDSKVRYLEQLGGNLLTVFWLFDQIGIHYYFASDWPALDCWAVVEVRWGFACSSETSHTWHLLHPQLWPQSVRSLSC